LFQLELSIFEGCNRFWWSLVSEVDWWDAVACTQCAADDGTGTFLVYQYGTAQMQGRVSKVCCHCSIL
jgi:hypothetical protein